MPRFDSEVINYRVASESVGVPVMTVGDGATCKHGLQVRRGARWVATLRSFRMVRTKCAGRVSRGRIAARITVMHGGSTQ